MTERLGAGLLPRLPDVVRRPAFDPVALECGIVHLGIGAFHRAHQAVYLQRLLTAGDASWQLAGGNLRPDMAETMAVTVWLVTAATALGPAL